MKANLLVSSVSVLCFESFSNETESTNTEKQARGIEVISVQGSRLASQRAIVEKHQANQIIDTLSADDIGQLPDLNIADAYRRIVGVQTINDSDEGSFISVRGVDPDLNLVTLDGMQLPVSDSDGGRRINLEMLPGSAVKRLEVYKTFTPDLNGNAIGGVLNLVTKSAYDGEGDNVIIDGAISYYALNDVPNDDDDGVGGQLGLLYSDKFGEDEQFGLVISARYNNKKRDEQKISNDTYRYDNHLQTPVNERLRTLQYTNGWQRYGGSIKLEWRPDENLYGFFNNFHYKLKEDEHRNFVYLENRDKADPVTGLIPNSQVSTKHTGFVKEARNTQRYSWRPTERTQQGYHLHVDKWLLAEHRIRFGLSYGIGEYDRPYDDFRFRTATTSQLGYHYDMSSLYTQIQLEEPSYIINPNNYHFSGGSFRQDYQKETLGQAKFQYSWNTGESAEGFGVDAGLSGRHMRQTYNWDEGVYEKQGQPLLLNDFYQSMGYTPENFHSSIFVLDHQAFYDYYRRNPSEFVWDETATLQYSLQDDYQFKEKVKAGWLSLNWTSEQLFVTTGVRYEKTELETKGYLHNTEEQLVMNYNSALYNNWLPSINATWNWTDDFKLRAAIGKSMARANPADVVAIESHKLNQVEGKTIVNRGNPKLRPRVSTNYDLSLEYYFDDNDSLFALALFRKDIADLIFNYSYQQLNSQGRITQYNQKKNANNARIDGLEVTWIKSDFGSWHESLNGLGLLLNATWIDAEMEYEFQYGGLPDADKVEFVAIEHLPEQADFMANAAVFYGWESGEVRLAYNYIDQYSDDLRTGSAPLERSRTERIWSPYSQVDFHIQHQFYDGFILRGQIRNLTNERRIRMTGENTRLFSEDVVFGRSIWLGATLRF